ncbi:MAG: beta-N-acetylhexosaminidase [Rickettsiales bacterium]
MSLSSVIFGLSGTSLTPDEISFFSEIKPFGYILFTRNCDDERQIRELTDQLRELSGRDDLPILIDQEGGRVARLKPPCFPEFPPASKFALMAEKNIGEAEKATYENAKKIAELLLSLGITVNCAPVADIPAEGAHDIIGDRAFGKNHEQVIKLAKAQAHGLMDGGVVPIIKHIPGHGRAFSDSHHELPVVDTNIDILRQSDFMPFKALSYLPAAMTAHILYSDIDSENIATTSEKIISMIRSEIGFDGLLMSDDLSMKAMRGDFSERTRNALAAGCDVVLHCNGDMEEMKMVAKELRPLSGKSLERAENMVDVANKKTKA